MFPEWGGTRDNSLQSGRQEEGLGKVRKRIGVDFLRGCREFVMHKIVRKRNWGLRNQETHVSLEWGGWGREVCVWNAVQREEESILLQIKSDFDESEGMKRAFEEKIKDIGWFISKR